MALIVDNSIEGSERRDSGELVHFWGHQIRRHLGTLSGEFNCGRLR